MSPTTRALVLLSLARILMWGVPAAAVADQHLIEVNTALLKEASATEKGNPLTRIRSQSGNTLIVELDGDYDRWLSGMRKLQKRFLGGPSAT